MALQRMYPTAHFCSWPSYGHGYGWHLAAGVSDDTTADCYSYCDDLEGALDETYYGFARSSSTATQVNHGRAEFTFGDPPQNVTIVSLTRVAWLRTSNAGTAIIASTPTVKFFNYVSGGSRVYQTGTRSVTAARNRNTQGPTGSFQKLSYTDDAAGGRRMDSRGAARVAVQGGDQRVLLARVPKPLQETSIGMATAGMMSLAFYAFKGMA